MYLSKDPGAVNEELLVSAAVRFGTPLVVYSEAALRSNAQNLRRAFPHCSNLAYSIKANPNPFILNTFRDLGLLVEVASKGEYFHAIACGFSASNIFFGGPGMPEAALRAVKHNGARALLLESANSIARSKRVGINEIPVLLRVNPNGLDSDVGTRMTGIPSPFGIDESEISGAVIKALSLGLNYAGLFLYVGTQVAGAKAIAANTNHLLKLDNQLSASGLPPARMLDFGGGFPVPETISQPSLDLEELHTELEKVILPQRASTTELFFESGRFLVNNAAILVTSVLDTKYSMGKHFAILDAGINVLGLRQLKYRTYPPMIRMLATRRGVVRPTTFVGPTCTPIDLIANDVPMPPLVEGDLLYVSHYGAYSTSFSPTVFCGHGYPAEVSLLENGTIELTRRRSRYPAGCYLR